MSSSIGLTDLTSFVSFDDSLDKEKSPPKLSRQQSRLGGLAAGSTCISGDGLNTTQRINDLEMTEKEKEDLMHTKTFRRIQSDIKERQKRLLLRNVSEKEKKEKSEIEEQNQEIEQQFYVDKDKQLVNVQGTICFLKQTLCLPKIFYF